MAAIPGGRALLAAACLGCAATPASAEDERWQAGAGFSVSSGRYGTDTRTTTTYIPFSLDRLFPRGKLGVTVPLISVKGDTAVTLAGGNPSPVGARRRDGAVVTESEGGLGDTLLRGSLRALEEGAGTPELELRARIKVPTASRSRGLGTGEFDETLGADLWKTVSGPWSALGGAAFTFVGDPPGRDLRDSWFVEAGAGYAFQPDLVGTLSVSRARAIVPGAPDPMDLVLGISHSGRRSTTLAASLQFGLSDGSPDLGVGLSAAWRFDRLPGDGL